MVASHYWSAVKYLQYLCWFENRIGVRQMQCFVFRDIVEKQ